jgi:hypothetical protein
MALCVLCKQCTLHSNHGLDRTIFQHTKRLLHRSGHFLTIHSHRLAAKLRRSMPEVPDPHFCKNGALCAKGLLVTRILLLPKTMKCGIGASGAECLKYELRSKTTFWGKNVLSCLNPFGGEIFRTRPDRPCGPPSLLYNGYRIFPGGKAAEAWCSPPTLS